MVVDLSLLDTDDGIKIEHEIVERDMSDAYARALLKRCIARLHASEIEKRRRLK